MPTRPKLYVAGSSRELDRARAVVATLSRHFEIVSTWIAAVESAGAENPTDRATRLRCLDELDRADTLLLLVPREENHSHGAFFELGYAVATRKRTVASGLTGRSIFCVQCEEEFESDRHAIDWLVNEAWHHRLANRWYGQ